jgi:hypothetical protein
MWFTVSHRLVQITLGRSHVYEAPRVQQAIPQQTVGAHNMYVPSLREMRGDPRLRREAEERCVEMDASYLGNEKYVTSKKARGLLRAGGRPPGMYILTGCMIIY